MELVRGRGAVGEDLGRGVGLIHAVVAVLGACAQALHDVWRGSAALGRGVEGAVGALGEDSFARVEGAVGVEDTVDFVDEDLAGNCEGALVALLGGAEEAVVADQLFANPHPLHAAVVLRVVELGDGIAVAPVSSTTSNLVELRTAVFATCYGAFAPQCPLCSLVERDVAAFGSVRGVVVEVALAVREGVEDLDF